MKRLFVCVMALLALALPALAASASKSQGVVVTFKNMYPVNGPFVTPQGAPDPNIQGIPGDSQDWTIKKSIKGQLFANGRLVIQVRGLVPAANTPNNLTEFYAAVSCLTPVTNPPDPTTIAPVSVATSGFPTGPEGNANIHAQLNLPSPCVAPVVMILNGDPANGGLWLAATGYAPVSGK
jgi:hypothetical protein